MRYPKRWQRLGGRHRGELLLSRCCRTICTFISWAMQDLHTTSNAVL